MAMMPAGQGVVNWPADGLSATALGDLDMMPLPTLGRPRVVVHALETDEHPGELLSEIWRILTPGGRMIAVVPNRRGLWARMDTTPFGPASPIRAGSSRGSCARRCSRRSTGRRRSTFRLSRAAS